jgi:hypothetical protein
MPKFKVLRPIELDGKLYVSGGDKAPETAKSACNGQVVAIDASGVIELTDGQAAEMVMGQVEQVKSTAKSQEAKTKAKNS